MYPDLCQKIRQKFQVAQSLQAKTRNREIVDQVTNTLLALKSAGKPLILPNAGCLTGGKWHPSKMRSTLFGLLRVELGADPLKNVPRHATTKIFLSLVMASKERLRAASK